MEISNGSKETIIIGIILKEKTENLHQILKRGTFSNGLYWYWLLKSKWMRFKQWIDLDGKTYIVSFEVDSCQPQWQIKFSILE